MLNDIHDIQSLKISIKENTIKSCPVLIGKNLLSNINLWNIDFKDFYQIVILTDETVGSIYADQLSANLQDIIKTPILILRIKDGESSKTASTKEWVELEMLKNNFGRNSLCIALGGGVVGDLAGFASATYMRGISYIQIPTSMLAMVDSSVGGKTAINTVYGKNLIGAFWQPIAVIIDLNCLNTLPKIELVSGLIEAIKVFLTCSRDMLLYVKTNIKRVLESDKQVLQYIIFNAVSQKAQIVEADEKETNLRMILNLGHSIGHALEQVLNYKILHGYAVAFGIIIEAKIAVIMNILDKIVFKEIVAIFEQLGVINTLNKQLGCNVRDGLNERQSSIDEIISQMLYDKKNKNGAINCILLKAIGKVYSNNNDEVITSVPVEIIQMALQSDWE